MCQSCSGKHCNSFCLLFKTCSSNKQTDGIDVVTMRRNVLLSFLYYNRKWTWMNSRLLEMGVLQDSIVSCILASENI